MSSSAFSPNIFSTATASGSGQLNVLTNPTGATGTLGWSGVTVVSGTSSPLNPVVTTAFSIANTAGAESATSGGYSTFTLPASLQNKKIKVEFYFTTPATDVYRLSIYKGSTRVPLSTDSSSVTTLPANTTGKFVAYFDTDTTATWSVNVTRTTGTTGPCYITNVIVGPDVQPQGFAGGRYESTNNYTITGSTSNPTPGTSPTYFRETVRDGSDAIIRFEYSQTGAGSAGSGTYYLPLPTGLTIDTTRIRQASTGFANSVLAGDGFLQSNTVYYQVNPQYGTTTAIGVLLANNAADGLDWGSTNAPLSTAANTRLSLTVRIPIAEWASSGTVQLAQNDVEFAYSTDTVSTAGNTQSDNGLYGYGPAGTNIVAIGSTTLSSFTTKRVRFQTPIQQGDLIRVEVNQGGNTDPWIPVEEIGLNSAYQARARFGIQWQRVSGSATDIQVQFGNGGATPVSATTQTYETINLDPWSGYTSFKWRVRKSSAGAAVGFGIVQGTSSGLVPAYNTNFDDVTATRLGFKEYLHGTTYNGGIAPTVTSAQGGFAVTRAAFVPYQMQDGSWRLRFNIAATYTLATVTSFIVSTNGVVFKNTSNYLQTVAVFVNSSGSPNFSLSYTNVNTGGLQITSSGVATSNTIGLSGDVELESKPTWAY